MIKGTKYTHICIGESWNNHHLHDVQKSISTKPHLAQHQIRGQHPPPPQHFLFLLNPSNNPTSRICYGKLTSHDVTLMCFTLMPMAGSTIPTSIIATVLTTTPTSTLMQGLLHHHNSPYK